MPREDDEVEIEDCKVRAETSEAILVVIPHVKDAVWIPLSQVSEDSEVYKKGDTGTLTITRWIAEKKELV